MQRPKTTRIVQNSKTKRNILAMTQSKITSYEKTMAVGCLMVYGSWCIQGVRGHPGRLRKIPLRKVHFHGVVIFAIAAIDV
jgi:hypothetical protein